MSRKGEPFDRAALPDDFFWYERKIWEIFPKDIPQDYVFALLFGSTDPKQLKMFEDLRRDFVEAYIKYPDQFATYMSIARGKASKEFLSIRGFLDEFSAFGKLEISKGEFKYFLKASVKDIQQAIKFASGITHTTEAIRQEKSRINKESKKLRKERGW